MAPGAARAWRALWVGRARHHAPTRPGSPSPRVRRAWTAAHAPLAIGARWAPGTRSDRLDPFDGARRGERAGAQREEQAPGTHTDGAQTPGTRGVAGGHPASACGRTHV